MSNKVIFNLDELFISVGIDVGADFSWMSIALPNQQFVGKPFKILHNSIDSLKPLFLNKRSRRVVFFGKSDFPESREVSTDSSAIFVIRVLTALLLIPIITTFRMLMFVLFLVMIGLITEQLKPLSRR